MSCDCETQFGRAPFHVKPRRSNPYWFASHATSKLLLHNNFGAGDGNRTHATSLGSWSSAIELHPRDGNEAKTIVE